MSADLSLSDSADLNGRTADETPISGGIGRRVPRPADCIVDTSKVFSWNETQQTIAALERIFGARVLSLFVDNDFSLTIDEVQEVYRHLAQLGRQKKLVVILYGRGGSGVAAYRIVRLLRRFAERVVVVVPEKALSAMTMLALGADEILTGPLSNFSPTDTSIAKHPLAPRDAEDKPVTVEIFQVKKYLELVGADAYQGADDFRKTPHAALTERLHPIFLGTIQRSLSLSKRLMKDIVQTHMTDPERIERIIASLNDDYPIHSYPILPDGLAEMGLPIGELSDEQNQLALDLIGLNEVLGAGNVETKAEHRKTLRRSAVVETTEFRSFYALERDEKLVDHKWNQVRSSGEYRRATIVKTKRGYYEAQILSPKNFRSWFAGDTVEVE